MKQSLIDAQAELDRTEPFRKAFTKLFGTKDNRVSKHVVYISGPMAGYKNWNHEAFNSMESLLSNFDVIVLNPATTPLGMKRNQYMVIDAALVQVSDVVVMLEGWEDSKGALMEKAIAESMGKVVVFQHEVEVLLEEYRRSE